MLHQAGDPEAMEIVPPVDPITGEDMSWKNTPAWRQSAELQRRINARSN